MRIIDKNNDPLKAGNPEASPHSAAVEQTSPDSGPVGFSPEEPVIVGPAESSPMIPRIDGHDETNYSATRFSPSSHIETPMMTAPVPLTSSVADAAVIPPVTSTKPAPRKARRRKPIPVPPSPLASETPNLPDPKLDASPSAPVESAAINAQEPATSESQAPGETPKEPSVKSPDATTADNPEPSAAIPPTDPLHIVMLTPELAPVAKVGGLGDVVFGLSRELERRGHTVEIILPKYDCMRYDHIWELHGCYDDLYVPWFKGDIHCSVSTGKVHGRICYFIDPHSNENFFNRGNIYGCTDDVMRFAFFCKAALEFLLKSGKRPDIIHSHDWPTGLASVLLYEMHAAAGMHRARACFTIHNFKHQGAVGDQVLWATGLGRPRDFFRPDRMLDNNNPRALNLMKAGIVYSNFVTTVSPHYAWDARFTDQGFGMQPTLNAHHAKYGGILNGVDYEYWNPLTDPFIPFHYGADNVEEKYRNKRALRERLGLADSDKPIISFVGRLDPQKGLDLIKHALFHCLGNKAQFVLLGNSPDARVNSAFGDLKRRLDNSLDCRLEISFNEELSHLVYAGSDMIIVPSLYEPCGLTQIIGLRYGAVPIVRAVGGLVDTVFDKDYSDKPVHQRNGYVFNDANTTALDWVLNRAISCYFKYPGDFRMLMLNGMKSNFSWEIPGGEYVDIYNSIRCR